MNPTREIILKRAFLLLVQHGYEGMSMLDLQRETGLSRGALYHHFKSKDELFAEVIDTFFIATPTTPDQALDITSLYAFYHGYYEHIKSVFKVLRENLKEISPENDFSMFSLGFDAMKRYTWYREKIRIIHDEVKKIWIHVVKTARETGEIETEMSDEHIAGCFIYLNEGIGIQFTSEGRGRDAEEELIKIWDSFYNEIKTES